MELNEYLSPLRRWWWLLVVGTLVAALSSYAALRRQPAIYQARATLMIGRAVSNPNPDYNEIYLTEKLANTYADIAMRSSVQEKTMASLGLPGLPAYSVQPVAETQLLEIVVTDVDPARAQAVANELANQLILQTPTGGDSEARQRQGFVRGQLDELEASIGATRAEITRQQEALGSLLSAREIADAGNQIQALQTKLATLQSNYAALLSNTDQGALNTLSLIEPATLPDGPVPSNRGRTIMLVAILGLLLSAGAAYLLAYLDDTIKNPLEVKRALGLTTLGAVPVVEGAATGGEMVMLAGGHSAAGEAYRVLRTNLQFAAVERPLRTLIVTSPAPSEGKSLTAANLAVALAQAGRRVIVLDADLHRPRLHRLFNLANNTGLTTALLEESPAVEGLVQATGVPGLSVLTTGALPPNPTELLGSARMRELLGELSAHADVVVIDTPPTVVLADTAVLAAQADGVLLVLDAGSTRRDLAQRGVETLRAVNAHLVGALLNRVPVRGEGYYYYYYYYKGYRSYYSASGNGHGPGTQRGFWRRKKDVAPPPAPIPQREGKEPAP